MVQGVTVLESVRHERLAWDAHCNGVHAYHAWAFEKRDGGVYVLTEETQTGWKARLGALVMPGRMSRWHQRWFESREGLVRKTMRKSFAKKLGWVSV